MGGLGRINVQTLVYRYVHVLVSLAIVVVVTLVFSI